MKRRNRCTVCLAPKGPVASETSASIGRQIAEFIRLGGRIDKIPPGVSGVNWLGRSERSKPP